jgi:dihydrofolate reductase
MWHAGRKANLLAKAALKKEDPMRRVRYSVAASLDGYIADADGRFDWIPEDQTVDFAALFARVDTILLGRRSFELVRRAGAPGWGPNMRVYVFSRTLRPADYPDVAVVGGNSREVVAGLRAEPGEGEIWLFGGGQLFSSLLAAGQVDAVEVTIVPVLLGGGVPLAAPGINRTKLVLHHTHQYPTGMVSLIYDVDPGFVKRELIS